MSGRGARDVAVVLSDPGFRNPKPWTVEKRELIAHGRDAADDALRRHGFR